MPVPLEIRDTTPPLVRDATDNPTELPDRLESPTIIIIQQPKPNRRKQVTHGLNQLSRMRERDLQQSCILSTLWLSPSLGGRLPSGGSPPQRQAAPYPNWGFAANWYRSDSRICFLVWKLTIGNALWDHQRAFPFSISKRSRKKPVYAEACFWGIEIGSLSKK